MARKKQVEEEAEKVEEVEEVKEISEIIVPPPVKKEKFVVILIRKNFAVIADEKNNGSRIPLTEKYKNIKVGDVIYR